MSDDDTHTRVRLDKWLWAARFFKTRSLAKQAIEGGRISVDGATVAKASKLVHVGDVLVVQRGEERFELRVLGLDSARGPASVAQALYAETDDGRARREAEVVRRRDERAGYRPPESRPNKKARRLIRALGDIDAMAVGLTVWRLGAGRARPGERVQSGAGVRIHRKPGEPVVAGEPLFTLYTDTPERVPAALAELDGGWSIADVAPPVRPLIIDRIG